LNAQRALGWVGGRTITPDKPLSATRRAEAVLERRRAVRRAWRSPLLWLPVASIVVALAAFGLRFLVQPAVLRVAVGPEGSADAKLLTDLASELARDNGKNVRLRVVKTAGAAESASELDAGRADLAVVRSDVAMSATGLTVAILHRNAVILVAPRSSKVRTIVDLNNKDVGIVHASPENERLLEQLLVEYGISSQAITLIPLDPDEVEEAVRTKGVDAVMVVAPASGALTKEVVASVATGSGREPVLVGMKEAQAIAQRKPIYESVDIVNGLFGGNPPRPSESYKTIAVTYRLVAGRNIEDYIVSDFTRRLFTLRMALTDDASLANRIEKPDREDASALPVHPGAVAYFDNDEKSFLDRYDDWFYLGAMGLSGLVSGLAALIASMRAWVRRGMLSAIDELIQLQHLVRGATQLAALDEAEAKVASISTATLRHARDGRVDESGLAALGLAMDECRKAIADRRVWLAADAGRQTSAAPDQGQLFTV
jgi:TRAP transporter TAXI family solute receptor